MLQELRADIPDIRPCTRWLDVEAQFNRDGRDELWKDRLLTEIFSCRLEDGRPEWQTILLLLFWNDLKLTSRSNQTPNSDQLALRTNVVWAFFEVVCHLDPSKRPKRLVQKIRNDTIRSVQRIYASQLSRNPRVEPLDGVTDDDEDEPRQFVAPVDHEWTAMMARLETRAAVRVLRSLARRGYVPERDLPLLIGTLIYGQTVSCWAEKRGIPLETAKKRRQRAIRRIRIHINSLGDI